MKKKTFVVVFSVCFTGTVLFFQNCSKTNIPAENLASASDLESDSNAANSSNSSDSLVKSCINNPTVKEEDVMVNPFGKISPGLSQQKLNENISLLALVDNECALKEQGYTLRNLIFISNELRDNPKQSAYGFHLDHTYSLDELISLADEDQCILNIDANSTLRIVQSTTAADPRVSSQKHLAEIQQSEVYSQLFNVDNGINSVVKVAVIDSGVDMTNPDMKDAQLVDSNGNIVGYNAITGLSDFTDSGYHGTHVSGIIGATSDNGFGGRGVLGRYIRILPVRVSADGSSVSMSAVITGIRWAADQGADVINMSLAGNKDTAAFKEAIQYAIDKGVFIAVASGNDGLDLSSGASVYPAQYSKDFEGMITVGSVDATTKAKSNFSNYSSNYVEIMAPGSDGSNGILSLVPMNMSSTGLASKLLSAGSTYPIQGTSMATPVVSGAAAMVYALAKSRGYHPTPGQVKKALINSSEVLAGLKLSVKDGKNLNLKKLVSYIDADMSLDITKNVSRTVAKGKAEVSIPPQNQVALVGSEVSFSVVLTETSSNFVNYQWYKNGKPILAETKNKLVLKNITEEAAATYTVSVTAGSAPAVLSQAATLTVGKQLCN